MSDRRRRYWPMRSGGLGLGLGVGGGGVGYGLNDSYNTDDAALITSPRTAEPGPGAATIRDTESKIAIASGWVEWTAQATAVYAEQDIVYTTPAIARAVGKILTGKYRLATDNPHYPLALVSSTTPAWNHTAVDAAFWRSGALVLSSVTNATVGPRIADIVADGTIYNLALILRAGGAYFLIKGGTYGTSWKLLRISTTGTAATVYAAAAGNTAVFSTDIFRNPTMLWTPRPVLADDFGGTWPALDNAVLTLTGLEAYNGAAKTWTAGPGATWTNALGYAVNAPVAGVEIVQNPSMDDALKWTIGTDWDVSVTTPGKATKVPGANVSYLTDTGADAIVGRWYRYGGDFVINAGYISYQIGGTSPKAMAATGNMTGTCRSPGTTKCRLYAANTTNGTADNISAKLLTTADLMQVAESGVEDCYWEVDVTTCATGFQAGIVFNYVDASNYNLAYLNMNDGKVYVDKVNAGVYTNISSGGTGLTGGSKLAVRKIGNSIYYWYNNVYLNVYSAADTDNSGTKHGLFATGSSATETKLNNFRAYAVGTNGEYSLLDMFCN